MNIYSVRQKNITDCGVAALLSIITFFGINTTYKSIRNKVKVDFFVGISMKDIIDVAEFFGFSCNALSCNWEELQKLPTPLIARIVYLKFIPHYVVIYAIDNNKITVMNPDLG